MKPLFLAIALVLSCAASVFADSPQCLGSIQCDPPLVPSCVLLAQGAKLGVWACTPPSGQNPNPPSSPSNPPPAPAPNPPPTPREPVPNGGLPWPPLPGHKRADDPPPAPVPNPPTAHAPGPSNPPQAACGDQPLPRPCAPGYTAQCRAGGWMCLGSTTCQSPWDGPGISCQPPIVAYCVPVHVDGYTVGLWSCHPYCVLARTSTGALFCQQ